jgi:hypothetical protein
VKKKRGGNSERNSGHQRRLANLKGHEFKPGKSGNPKGRPPTRGLLVHLRKQLEDATEGQAAEELIAQKLVDLAKAGDLAAIRECFDRIEGRPKQSVDLDVTERFPGRSIAELERFAEKDRWPEEEENNGRQNL